MLKNTKVLVTGLTGNLGGSITNALLADNDVWGYARYSQQGQQAFWQQKGVHTVVGDFADGDFENLPDDFDYVIHCAANCGPETFAQGMRDNVQGTALLMNHCRKVKAFLHISSIGVYTANPDPQHEYRETDLTGAALMGHYEGTKLATEGAVWAMAHALNIPTVIGRLGIQYGAFHDGGWLGILLKSVLAGEAVYLPQAQTNIVRPISDDDVVNFLGPLLNVASIPPVTVNLAGDETIAIQDVVAHFGNLAGVRPEVILTDAYDFPTYLINGDLRRELIGPCKVPIMEGLTRLYNTLAPSLQGDA